MANEVKNYFLAPSWDYTPDTKPGVTIALWNVVTSPTKVVPPLVAATTVPNNEDIGKSTKYGFEWARERNKEKKFGVWTTFLDQLAGIGLKLGHKRATSIHDLYTFETMNTAEAYPSREYVEQMVKTEPVKKYLEKFDFEKPVYLVVGTKSVSGTTVKQVLKNERSTDMKLSANATPSGAPLALSPELNLSTKKGDAIRFDGSTDFVFAFRIRKIVVSKKFEVEDESDAEGGVLGEGELAQRDIEVQGIEERDAADLPAGGKKVTVEDNDEKVYVTVIEDDL